MKIKILFILLTVFTIALVCENNITNNKLRIENTTYESVSSFNTDYKFLQAEIAKNENPNTIEINQAGFGTIVIIVIVIIFILGVIGAASESGSSKKEYTMEDAIDFFEYHCDDYDHTLKSEHLCFHPDKIVRNCAYFKKDQKHKCPKYHTMEELINSHIGPRKNTSSINSTSYESTNSSNSSNRTISDEERWQSEGYGNQSNYVNGCPKYNNGLCEGSSSCDIVCGELSSCHDLNTFKNEVLSRYYY